MSRPFINRQLIKQSAFDSGALTPLVSLIHTIKASGEYLGTLYLNEQAVGNFHLNVEDRAPNTQVSIDLAGLHSGSPRQASLRTPDQFKLRTNGHVVFYVSAGRGGYAITLHRVGSADKDAVLDSRALRDGDVFLVALLRPGTYRLLNVRTGQESKVTVGYPEQGKTAITRLALTPVEIGERGFSIPEMEIRSGQGLAVQCNAPSRLRLELVESIERQAPVEIKPGASRPGKVTWRKSGVSR